MSAYRLKFVDSLEQEIRVIDLDAVNDDRAIDLACLHSVKSNLDVELLQSERMIMRMTPMTARLFLQDADERAGSRFP